VSAYDSRARYFALSRFPYRIVFTREGHDVVIIAFAHRRRRPGYWRDA